MKKLLFVLLCAFSISISAQELYSDDFESYNVGEGIAAQCPDWWKTWTNAPGSAEDPVVSENYALSGDKSVMVSGENDGVIDFEGITEGRYRVEFYIYIPDGKQAYYNIMQNFSHLGTGLIWGLQVFFQDGICRIDGAGASAKTLSYQSDEWIKFQHFIDLDNDWIDMYINDELVHAYQWSQGTFGNNGGINQLGAFNFYAWNEGGTCEYYLDDFLIEEADTPYPPLNFSAEIVNDNDVVLNWDQPEDGEPQSYTISRNGVEIAVLEDDELTYTDLNLYPDTYNYQVLAYYGTSMGFSSPSDNIEVDIAGGIDRDLVLFEVFTGTWCPYCPTAAKAIKMIDEQHFNVAVIKYHGDDSFETPATATRTNFYLPFFAEPGEQSFGYPTTIVEGLSGFQGAYPDEFDQFSAYVSLYTHAKRKRSLYSISDSEITLDENQWVVNIEVEKLFKYYDDELRLFVALTETDIPHSWLGQTHVNHVLRKFYPNNQGEVLDFNDTDTFSKTIEIDWDNDSEINNFQIVAFVQNMSTGNIEATHIVKPDLGEVSVLSHIDSKIKIFPNPAYNNITIHSNAHVNKVEVYNYKGQLVLINSLNDNNTIDISSKTSGVYFVKIHTDNKVETKKLIIK